MVPTVATIVCSTLVESEFDNGDGTFDTFMAADMSIEASGARYRALRTYAMLMTIVWVFGPPLALFTLLWSKRVAIESRDTQLGGPELESLSFFFNIYKPCFWWLSVTDLSRRLVCVLQPLATTIHQCD